MNKYIEKLIMIEINTQGYWTVDHRNRPKTQPSDILA